MSETIAQILPMSIIIMHMSQCGTPEGGGEGRMRLSLLIFHKNYKSIDNNNINI